MMDEETPNESDALPSDFWAAPERFIRDQNLQFLHAEVCARLRRESPEADTLEQMCMERVASLYFYMRDKEANSGGLNSATAYHRIMQLWVSMATDLRKSRTAGADEESIRSEVTASLVSAVAESLKGLEPEVAMTVSRRVRQSLGT